MKTVQYIITCLFAICGIGLAMAEPTSPPQRSELAANVFKATGDECHTYGHFLFNDEFYLFLGDEKHGRHEQIKKATIRYILQDARTPNPPEPVSLEVTLASAEEITGNSKLHKAYQEWIKEKDTPNVLEGKGKAELLPTIYKLKPMNSEALTREGRYRLVIPQAGKEVTAGQYEDMQLPLGSSQQYNVRDWLDIEAGQELCCLDWASWAFNPDIEVLEDLIRNHLILKLDSIRKPLVYDSKKNAFVGTAYDSTTGAVVPIAITYKIVPLLNSKRAESISFHLSQPLLLDTLTATFSKRGTFLENAFSKQSWRWELGRHAPSACLDAGNNGIMTKGSKAVRSEFTGIDNVTFDLYRIKPGAEAQALHTYSKDYTTYLEDEEPEGATGRKQFTVRPAQLPTSQHFALQRVSASKGNTYGDEILSVTLDDIVQGKAPSGMYFLDVFHRISPHFQRIIKKYKFLDDSDRPREGKNVLGIRTQSMLQVTDVGLLYKWSGKQAFFYAYSLSNGKPIGSARITILDNKGKVLIAQNIKDGTCVLSCRDNVNAAYARCEQLDAAGTVVDSYLTPFDGRSHYGEIDMWSFDIQESPYFAKIFNLDLSQIRIPKVFMFSDRTLYRPGETMHLKGIIRDLTDNQLSLSTVKSVNVSIKSNKDIEVWKDTLPIDDNGTFLLTYSFPPVQTGDYRIEVKLDNVTLPKAQFKNDSPESYYYAEMKSYLTEASYSVKVEEFKRNEFEVTSTITPPEVGATIVTADVAAVNLTGNPVSGGDVRLVIKDESTNLYPEKYRDYFFGDQLESDMGYWQAYYGYTGHDRSSNINYADAILDTQGKTSKQLKISTSDKPTIKKISILTYVTNKNQQTVRDFKLTTYYPSNAFVGIKTQNVFNAQGTFMNTSLVAVGQDGMLYQGGDLKLHIKVTAKSFQSTRTLNDSGTSVESDPVAEVVLEKDIILSAADSANSQGGLILSIPTPKSGKYDIEITGTDDKGLPIYTGVRRWVYGADESPWAYRDGLGITIIPDKKLYRKGDTARLLLQTPINAELMVTVERNGVMKSYTREVTVDNPVIEVPIEDGFAPNVYVCAFLVKGADFNRREVKNPQLKLGYTCLNVCVDDKKLNIALTPPQGITRSGEKVTVMGNITDAEGKPVAGADVCLYAVDEGTLQVSGYNLPNPLGKFYETIPLDVLTATTLEQLLDEDPNNRSFDNKGVFVGGGGLSSGLSPAIRHDFNPLAVWVGNVAADANGNFSTTFASPDLLTRYRVMAVALSGADRFGSAQSEYLVNKPVMLEPAPPSLAATGDSLDIPVTVSQTINRTGEWIVTLRGCDTVEINSPTQYITLTGNQPQALIFNVKMKSAGEAKLVWEIKPIDAQKQVVTQGKEAEYTDAVESKFDIVLPLPALKEQFAFALDAGAAPTDLSNAFKVPFADGAKATWTLSPNPFLYGEGAATYLLQYPYGCLEQLSSCLLPWLYQPFLKDYIPALNKLDDGVTREKAIKDGIGKILANQHYNGGFGYWSSDTETSEYSAYAGFVLTIAVLNEEHVPAQALDKFYKFASDRLNSGRETNMLYALCLGAAERLTDAQINKILDANKFASTQDILYFILAIGEHENMLIKRKAAELLKQVKADASNTALFLMAKIMLEGAEENAPAVLNYLRESAMEGTNRYSTQSAAWNFILMSSVIDEYSGRENHSPLQVLAQIGAESHKLTCNMQQEATLSSILSAAISMSALGTQGKVYGLGVATGKVKLENQAQQINHGIQVVRGYEKFDGKGAWVAAESFQVGDIVRVSLTGKRTNANSPCRYLVVEDYTPSTFEVMNPALASQYIDLPKSPTENFNVSNQEYLKDRVRFFSNFWNGEPCKVTYYARVTKSGKVTAPAATIQLMYDPAIYGLSIPAPITIEPKQ